MTSNGFGADAGAGAGPGVSSNLNAALPPLAPTAPVVTGSGVTRVPSSTGNGVNLHLKVARSVTQAAPGELIFRTQKAPRVSDVAGSGASFSGSPSSVAPGGVGGQLPTPRGIPVSVDRCWEYWRKQLRSPAVFTLLTDFPRPVPTSAPTVPPAPASNSPDAAMGAAAAPAPWEPDLKLCASAKTVRAELPARVVDQIKGVSLQHHATLFEAFLAVFQVLLFRYSRETDVTVNTDTGLNIVPLRTAVTGELSFKQLLRLTKITVEQAFHYDLVGLSSLASDLATPEFSTVAFQLQYEDERADADAQLFIRAHELGLEVDLHEEGIAVVSLHYNPALFTTESAQQFLEHYATLCDTLAQNESANATIAVVPLTTPTEADALVALRWPEAVGGPLVDHSSQAGHEEEYAWSTDEHLPDMFERQAAKTPNAPCIDDEGRVLTYKQVNDRANAIARLLLSDPALGIVPGTDQLVATLLPRCGDVYVCQLAIMKAGCGYVCVDCTYPQDRVDYILKDSGSRILLTVTAFSGRQKECPEMLFDDAVIPVKIATYEADAAATDARAAASAADKKHARSSSSSNSSSSSSGTATDLWLKAQRTAAKPRGTDVCYVIYTSGTTGVPKGVVIEHRAAVNFVKGEGAVFKVKPHDRVLQGFSTSFDASVEEIWLAFYSGATLVVGTLATMQSGPSLPQLLHRLGITVVSTVPTLLTMISPPPPGAPVDAVDNLPLVWLLILGGEACPPELVARWAPGRTLINSYGPTEATVVSTFERSQVGRRVTIGRPLPNYFCTVLDANNQPCPVGMPGELLIGGASLARGYLNLQDKTDEKFVPTPFPALAATVPMLYKTGDLCRFLRSGDIEFLGRIDSQVKLRGFRVELSEIESVITQLPYVRSAVVAVKGQNLIAFVVPKDPASASAAAAEGAEAAKHGSVFVEDANSLLLPESDPAARAFDAAAAREYMKKMLPHYMMPGLTILVKDIPSLPSGKADRKTLLQIQPPRAAVGGTGGSLGETRKKKAAGAVKRAGRSAREKGFSTPDALQSTRFFRHASVDKQAAIAAALAQIEKEFGPNAAKPPRTSAEAGAQPDSDESDVTDDETAGRGCRRGHGGEDDDDEEEDGGGLTPLEREVRGVWEEVLGQSPIAPEQDFFTDLGGHSVVAALVVSAMRKRGYVASMRDLYGSPTVTGFSAVLLQEPANQTATAAAATLTAAASAAPTRARARAAASARAAAPAAAVAAICGAGSEGGVEATADSVTDKGALQGYRGPLMGWFQDWMVFAFQTLALFCAIGWLALLRVGIYYGVRYIYDHDILDISLHHFALLACIVPPVMTALTLISLLLLVPFKWLLLGRVRAGRYPMYGWFHMRWWLVSKITASFPFTFFRNTWVTRWLMRLLGASIGSRVYLSSFLISDFDLITIHSDAAINTQARLSPHRFEDGFLILEPIVIGRGAVIGPRAAVSGGVTVAEYAELEALSLLPPHAHTEPFTLYRGSPAKAVGPAPATPDVAAPAPAAADASAAAAAAAPEPDAFAALLEDEHAPAPRRYCSAALVSFATFVSMSLYGFFTLYSYLPVALGFYLYLGPPRWSVGEILQWSPLAVLAFTIAYLIIIIVLRWVVCWQFAPGAYTTDSWTYFRKWYLDMLTDLSVQSSQTLFATVYTPLFLRLMGVKMGARVECSTLFDYTPNLTVLEDESFIADHVATGSIVVRRNAVELRVTTVGSRTFVGNNAVLVAGSTLAANSLIGVSSVPPVGAMADGTSWVGSPSFRLPARKSVAADEGATYSPHPLTFLHRAWWEFWKILFPVYLGTINYAGLVFLTVWAVDAHGPVLASFLFFPLFAVTLTSGVCLAVIALKWLLIGKFRTRTHPLWSIEVWRAEFVQGVEENLIAPLVLTFAQGSWWCVLWFRLMGANIGDRVYLDTIYLTEPDLITIEDDAVVESATTVQTHLFEDRVMKMEPLTIGRGCAVGANSVVLYSSVMEEGAVLDQCSLVMKGETLMRRLKYEGIPAVAAAHVPVPNKAANHADYVPPIISSVN
jgi:non-ribosomal peptide synthetase-like protein